MNGTTRRSAVLLGVVLAALSVFVLVDSVGDAPARAPAVEAMLVSDASAATTTEPSSPPLDALESSVPAARQGARAAVDPHASATWIDGRVEFPGGTTPGSPVELVRQSKTSEWLPPARFPVEADGSFRVAVPPDAQSYVDLASRELRIEAPVRVDPADASKPIVLRALRAGRVRGRIVLGPGTEHERFTGATVAVVRVGRGAFDAVPRNLSTRADARLEFEAGGLDPNVSYEMRLLVDERVRARSDRVQVVGGKLADVVIHVTPAARVSGHVTDASGAPVADARVLATEVLDGRARAFGGAATTPADGSFSIAAYEGSVLGVRARKPGYLPADVALEPLDGGEARSGLVVVLGRGPSVAGIVQWPDGKPVESAHVEVLARYVTERSGRTTQEPYTITAASDRDGRFEVHVSHASAVIVRARAHAASRARTRVEHPNRWWSGPDARSPNRSVEPGSAPVVLTLERNVRIEGVVVDDLGVPLRAFTARAAPIVGSDGLIDPGEIVEAEFSGERGEFSFDELSPGEWMIAVAASDSRAASRAVSWTPTATAMRFVIDRAARVRGHVVDASGAAAAGCKVLASTTSSSPFTTLGEQVRVHSVPCDARGRFAIDELPPGTVRIWAQDGSGANGASTEVHLSPGSTIDGFVLALR